MKTAISAILFLTVMTTITLVTAGAGPGLAAADTAVTGQKSAEADEALVKDLFKTGTGHLRNYFSKGDLLGFTAAVRAFNRILLIDPADESARMMLGLLHTRRGHELADGLASEGLKKPAGYFQLGNLLLMQNRYGKAVESYEKVNAAIPAWACPFRHKGEALLKSGRVEEAIAALRKSVELRENHFDGYVFLGRALTAAGRLAEAEKELDTAVECAKKAGQCGANGEDEATMRDCWSAYAELYDKWQKPEKAAAYKARLNKLN